MAKTNTPAKKSNLLTKRRTRKEINLVIKANSLFIDFINSIEPKHEFDDQDKENLAQMKEHFGNLNAHFGDVLNNIK